MTFKIYWGLLSPFPIQGYIHDEILHEGPIGLSRDISQIDEKMPYLAMLKITSKIPGSGSGAYDFHNLIISSLSTDALVVKFS